MAERHPAPIEIRPDHVRDVVRINIDGDAALIGTGTVLVAVGLIKGKETATIIGVVLLSLGTTFKLLNRHVQYP